MIQIDKELIQQLFDQTVVNPRLRQSYELRNSEEDVRQRLLYALMLGTKVDIHRHPNSNETFVCLCGKEVEVFYEEDSLFVDFPIGMDAQYVVNGNRLKESERYMLDHSIGNFGCVVPKGVWHTIEVLEPCVILKTKEGKYGDDGTESFA